MKAENTVPETVCPRSVDEPKCTYPECECPISYLPADKEIERKRKRRFRVEPHIKAQRKKTLRPAVDELRDIVSVAKQGRLYAGGGTLQSKAFNKIIRRTMKLIREFET